MKKREYNNTRQLKKERAAQKEFGLITNNILLQIAKGDSFALW